MPSAVNQSPGGCQCDESSRSKICLDVWSCYDGIHPSGAVESALVAIKSGGDTVATGATDSSGHACINVAEGTYTIEVSKTGYTTETVSGVGSPTSSPVQIGMQGTSSFHAQVNTWLGGIATGATLLPRGNCIWSNDCTGTSPQVIVDLGVFPPTCMVGNCGSVSCSGLDWASGLVWQSASSAGTTCKAFGIAVHSVTLS
jgi:hypothetical protein